jgi:16S rRNA (guanine527-N7)-methyltransferase
VIVARALARLSTLLAYAHEIAGQATLCLFLKGQDVGVELTEASRYWQMDVERLPSATSAGSCVLAIRQLRAKTGKAPRA